MVSSITIFGSLATVSALMATQAYTADSFVAVDAFTVSPLMFRPQTYTTSSRQSFSCYLPAGWRMRKICLLSDLINSCEPFCLLRLKIHEKFLIISATLFYFLQKSIARMGSFRVI